MFFSLFKKYYEPIKPLYLCRTENDTKECIHSVDSRSNFPNICNILNYLQNDNIMTHSLLQTSHLHFDWNVDELDVDNLDMYCDFESINSNYFC